MAYRSSEADLERDLADVEALWARNFEDEGRRRCEFYQSNPDGKGAVWLLRTPEGGLVGASGLLSRLFQLGPRTCMVGQAVNLAVDAAHRSAGPALQLQRAVLGSLSANKLPLVLGVTVRAEAVQKRAGFREVGHVVRWTKPLRSGYVLRRYLPRVLADAVAAVLDVGMRLTSREAFSRCPVGWQTHVTTTFDDRFDRLWERAVKFPLVAARTARRLDWRFRRGGVPFQVFCLDQGEELLGYVVYRVEGELAYVMDLFFRDVFVLDALLAAFLLRLRDDEAAPDAVSTSYFGTSAVSDRLRRFGFRKRPEVKKLLLHAREPALSVGADLLDPESWYLTEMDIEL